MPVQIILIQMNLPPFNSTRSVVTSTSDMSAPELNFKCPRKGYEYLCNGIISGFFSNKFAKIIIIMVYGV